MISRVATRESCGGGGAKDGHWENGGGDFFSNCKLSRGPTPTVSLYAGSLPSSFILKRLNSFKGDNELPPLKVVYFNFSFINDSLFIMKGIPFDKSSPILIKEILIYTIGLIFVMPLSSH